MSQNGERTEKPTGKRLQDARKRGQVPRSRDLAVAVASLAVTLALARLGPSMAARLGQRLIDGFMQIGEHARSPLTNHDVSLLLMNDAWLFVLAVGPLLVVGAVMGVASNVMQSGWVMATEALQLKWERLSPAAGLSRLKPSQSGVDLLKAMVAVTTLSVLSVRVVRGLIDGGAQLAWMAPADAATSGWSSLLRLMYQAGFALLAIAGADYGVQRWRHTSSLKMTKQEVREEAKMQEGSPEVKGRVRRIQREISRRRMLKAVKNSTVVITNPTHFAVAIEYRRHKMAAPIVVAKGADHMAQRIKAIAREHGIPMVENVSLAQALYKGAEIGDAIPSALFGAVAEVLAYLVRIKQLML